MASRYAATMPAGSSSSGMERQYGHDQHADRPREVEPARPRRVLQHSLSDCRRIRACRARARWARPRGSRWRARSRPDRSRYIECAIRAAPPPRPRARCPPSRDAGAEVQELRDTQRAQLHDHAVEEGPVRAHHVRGVREHLLGLFGQFAVGGEVVRATEKIVVHPRHRRPFDVDLIRRPRGPVLHEYLARHAERGTVPAAALDPTRREPAKSSPCCPDLNLRRSAPAPPRKPRRPQRRRC